MGEGGREVDENILYWMMNLNLFFFLDVIKLSSIEICFANLSKKTQVYKKHH